MSVKYLLLLLAATILTLIACTDRPSTGEDDSTPVETAASTVAVDEIEAANGLELIAAAERGDVEAVQLLLASGSEIKATDARGRTALIAAAYENHIEVARVLIAAGADVNVQDNSLQSAYLITTSEGYLELLIMTLAAGADVHSLDFFNGTGLIRAADRGHVEIVAELLKTEIAIDHVNRLGWTALLEAIILGDGGERHTEVVRLLVEAGADVGLADGNGVTPAEHAHRRGYDEILTLLTTQSGQPIFLTPTPLLPPVPTPTPGPLYAYTIPGLREREFVGGQITIRQTMAQNEQFSQYYIDYPSDGLTITGVMHVPAGSAPFPVLILLHGYLERDSYFAGADTWQAAEYFARRGYLVIAPDLRSWGESDSALSLFHTGLVVDVLNLVGALPSLPAADSDRVGLWGHSMGGGIATKVLTIDDRIQAAVLYAPNSADDADLIDRWGLGCLDGQTEAIDSCNPAEIIPAGTAAELINAYLAAPDDAQFMRQIAPIYHLENVTAALQIHIGSADGQSLAATPPEWSFKLADALSDVDMEVSLFSYDGQGHFFVGEAWELLLARAEQFFRAQL